jgi:hypothetical protein
MVGPGSYEPARSEFAKKEPYKTRGPIISTKTLNLSPRLRAAISNPGLLKIGTASIPSKLLTPVIDSDIDRHTNLII